MGGQRLWSPEPSASPVPKAKSNEQSSFEQNANPGWVAVLPSTMHRSGRPLLVVGVEPGA